MRRGWALVLATLALPAQAELIELTPPEPFRAICTLPEICRIDGGCSGFPALGEIVLLRDAEGYRIGPNDEDLAAIDHYPSFDAIPPLPELNGARREILVDLPRDATTIRFALLMQITDPETGAERLRTRYFAMHCQESAR